MKAIARPDLIRINTPLAERWRQLNFSAETLAEAADLSPSYIYNLATGRGKPSYDVLRRLCHILRARPDEIFPDLAPDEEVDNAD